MGKWLALLGVVVLLVAGAFWVRRRSPEDPRRAPSTPADPAVVPAPPPIPAGAATAPAPAPKSRARSTLERVLAALRSGDREMVKEALEELRAEIVPHPVPDGENAAVLYRKAFELYPEGLTGEEADWAGRLVDGQALTTAQRAALQGVLDRSREALRLLHEAADRPRCNFDLDYAQGPAMEMNHITGLFRTARLLDLEALLGEGPAVSEAARAVSRLADAVADEPVLISQLVRGICHEIAAGTREREFEGDLSAEALRSLVASLSPERIRGGYEKTMLFELYSGVKFALDGGDPAALLAGTPGVPRRDFPLAGPDLAYYAETLSEYAGLVGRPLYEVRGDLERLQAARVDGAPAYAELSRLLLPAMMRTCERQARVEATLGTEQLAAALRLHRETRGSYPATLEELPVAPVDPFTGKPFFYRREGAGFVVWSAGEDGIDGGGVSPLHDLIFRSKR